MNGKKMVDTLPFPGRDRFLCQKRKNNNNKCIYTLNFLLLLLLFFSFSFNLLLYYSLHYYYNFFFLSHLLRLFVSGKKGQETSFRSFVDLLFRVAGRTERCSIVWNGPHITREKWAMVWYTVALHTTTQNIQFEREKKKKNGWKEGGETRWPRTMALSEPATWAS